MKNVIRSWISDSIVKGSLLGWLIKEDDFSARKAYFVIGNKKYWVLCNRKRKEPKSYPNHLCNGFLLNISFSMFRDLLTNPSVEFYDYELNKLICRKKIRITPDDFSYYLNYNLGISQKLHLIYVSSLFDREWYSSQHNLSNDGLLPEEHYYFIGWKNGDNPSRLFSTSSYMLHNNLRASDNQCPLVNCIESKDNNIYMSTSDIAFVSNIRDECKKELLLVKESKYFDSCWYENTYNDDIKSSGLSPAEHYYYIGWHKGFCPSRLFDVNYYSQKYHVSKTCPLLHYISKGQYKGYFLNLYSQFKSYIDYDYYYQEDLQLIKSSSFWNEDFYKKNYLPNDEFFDDPAIHYYLFGWKQGFNPSLSFSTKFYLNCYPELKKKNICPLVHYVRHGSRKNQKINEIFDNLESYSSLLKDSSLFSEIYYKESYMVDNDESISPIEHYLLRGWWNGCNPSLCFDNDQYIDCYPNVGLNCLPPLVHYLKQGKQESKIAIPVFKDVSSKRNVNDTPLISVIITSYNYAHYIGSAIDSVLNQSYKNFEVIVVDDGSNDESLQVISKYVRENNNVFLYTHENNKNLGLAATIMLGIEKAQGLYIAFCESDDYWDVNYLSEKVDIVNNNANAHIIINDVELFGDLERIKFVKSDIAIRKRKFITNRVFITPSEFRLRNWILTFSCVMVKSNLLKQCNFTNNIFEPNLDWWLWRQLCANNYIYYVNKKLTHWRLHKSYMSNSYQEGRIRRESFLSAGDRYLISSYKCKELLRYTDINYFVKNGLIYYKNKSSPVEQPSFSLILTTFNRIDKLRNAVDSVLQQSYSNYELIIVDDGSVDGTKEWLNQAYKSEIKSGRIVVLSQVNKGVSAARNVGIKKAKNDWIAYIDSDNCISDVFLESYAVSILKYPKMKTFYSMLICNQSGRRIGKEFNFNDLLRENYIDLGVFCHHKSLFKCLGGFNEKLNRLVDWDLIIRYTKMYKPVFIEKELLLYNDISDYDRITNNTDVNDAFNYIRKSYCTNYPIITTVITSFNHEKYISKAIESAVSQKGEFIHEILISDDGSSDRTRNIIQYYCHLYPNIIVDISNKENIGISHNLKKCFSMANGKYVAILEGDDYWVSEKKLQKQLDFMLANRDCSMVFSRIKMLKDGKFSLLDRQELLPSKLTGDDLIKEPSLNCIANFSCCFFDMKVVKKFPKELFDGRFNEIAVSFFVERFGKIGYIPSVLSVYRIHNSGTWSSLSDVDRVRSKIDSRNMAIQVCRTIYREKIYKDISREKMKEHKI